MNTSSRGAVELAKALAASILETPGSALDTLAREELAPRMTYVIYPGQERYPMAEGVEALPVGQVAAIANSA